MDKTEQICRALCAQNGIDPDQIVYNTKEAGNESPAWMLYKEFVNNVLTIIALR